MGKATQLKIAKQEMDEARLMSSFLHHNQKIKNDKLAPVKPVSEKLARYAEFFIRPLLDFESRLKSKDEQRLLMELVRYSFARYPVCPALQSVWIDKKVNVIRANRNGHLTADFKLWYICVASGGSLYKTYAKEHLTKKEVHTLVTCPHELTIEQALYYSVAKCANAPDGMALRIAKSKLHEKSFCDFWRTVARFFALHTPKNINQINDLLDYIEAKHVETPNFTMNGKTLDGLLKSMTDWHYMLRRIKVMGNSTWEGVYLPDEEFKTVDISIGQEVIWTMTQIKTSKALAAEGNRMRHCVYSYKQKCVNGSISIWSLSKNDTKGISQAKVTIELREDGSIAQARGLANRAPRNDERNVINQWVKRNNLSY